jgi:hypothetical protein
MHLTLAIVYTICKCNLTLTHLKTGTTCQFALFKLWLLSRFSPGLSASLKVASCPGVDQD